MGFRTTATTITLGSAAILAQVNGQSVGATPPAVPIIPVPFGDFADNASAVNTTLPLPPAPAPGIGVLFGSPSAAADSAGAPPDFAALARQTGCIVTDTPAASSYVESQVLPCGVKVVGVNGKQGEDEIFWLGLMGKNLVGEFNVTQRNGIFGVEGEAKPLKTTEGDGNRLIALNFILSD